MARPGIMLYFDILEPIKVLSDADKGQLLVAMLEYGQDGKVPQFDGMLEMAWAFVKPKIDKDEESYEDSVLQRRYAAFCKKRWRLKLPKIAFDEWVCMSEDEQQRLVDPVASRYPTTATATATVTDTATDTDTTTATATAAAVTTTTNTTTNEDGGNGDAESMVSVMGGSLGKGVVFLSQEQMDDLLDRMGIDTFDYYVDKLSRFIIEKNARVKNHYDTILKWWTEDGKI